MRVLIVKLSALGDVVQSLPVACAIKDQVPEARVDWLVEAPTAPLLAGHPCLERVLVSPRHDDGRGLLARLGGFWEALREAPYDWVLDLQGLMKSAIFVSLARGAHKVGFQGGKEPLAALSYDLRLPAFDPDRPALERYLDLLDPLGLARPARPRFGIVPGAAERERVTGWLAELGEGGPLVVLHPMAKWASKLWPRPHWVELARRLMARGARLVLTGSVADRAVTAAIAAAAGGGEAASGRLRDWAGRLDLRELAELLGRAAVVVCPDTGVMHLAAAMGGRVVALFGPTAPWRTGPHGGGHRVLRRELACAPCFQRECPTPRCLGELTPAEVAAAVGELLDQAISQE